jgi:cytoskeletal protein RodZ
MTIYKMENTDIFNKNNNDDYDQLSLGDLLRLNRKKAEIDIKEVANFLKVRSNDIKLLENNDIEKIAKNIYIPGLIKSYGKYLKINSKIINEKIQELSLRSNIEVKKHTLINLGNDRNLSPSKNLFFNSVLIFITMFLFLIIFFSLERKKEIINTENIIFDIQKINN